MKLQMASYTSDHYDENVAARETFNQQVSIRRYISGHVKRPTVWKIGVWQLSAAGIDQWIGCITRFNGKFNVYLRGENLVRFELTNLDTEDEALDALRWAIARLYP